MILKNNSKKLQAKKYEKWYKTSLFHILLFFMLSNPHEKYELLNLIKFILCKQYCNIIIKSINFFYQKPLKIVKWHENISLNLNLRSPMLRNLINHFSSYFVAEMSFRRSYSERESFTFLPRVCSLLSNYPKYLSI